MTSIWYAALLVAAATTAPAGVWVWPVSPVVILRPFEAPPTPYAAGHRGVDLAAWVGQPVVAAGAGVVSFAGQVGGTRLVVVRHGALRTTYEPVTPLVSAGQTVDRGQRIGTVTAGHAGCRCLHFGLRRGDAYLDPASLFAGGPVRLLPVGPPTVIGGATLTRAPPVDVAASAGQARASPSGALLAGGVVMVGGGATLSVALGRRPRR